jgi:hypothetical protein
MNEIQYQEIIAMLTVLSKRLDNLERKINGGTRIANIQTYLSELKKAAQKISDKITY